MHYLIGVILPFQYDGDKLHEAISEILKPWDERDGDNEDGRWDWWQLGGRWTGIWSDYNPREDPANHEVCWLCEGTGLRNDRLGQAQRLRDPSYTCNGCEQELQPGTALKWPTRWVKRPDLDLIPVKQLRARTDDLPYAIVAAPDRWLGRETWTGDTFITAPNWPAVAHAALDNYLDCWIAAVDIHR